MLSTVFADLTVFFRFYFVFCLKLIYVLFCVSEMIYYIWSSKTKVLQFFDILINSLGNLIKAYSFKRNYYAVQFRILNEFVFSCTALTYKSYNYVQSIPIHKFKYIVRRTLSNGH